MALTLREKVSLLSGKDSWSSMPVDRLEVQSVVMTDGLHGARSANPDTGRGIGPATTFPTGKLPVTLPRKLEHSPAYIIASYDGVREVRLFYLPPTQDEMGSGTRSVRNSGWRLVL